MIECAHDAAAPDAVVPDLDRTRKPNGPTGRPPSGGAAWPEGNIVRPLIHGATYLAELHRRVSQTRDGDLLMSSTDAETPTSASPVPGHRGRKGSAAAARSYGRFQRRSSTLPRRHLW